MAAPIHLEVLADLFNKIDPTETFAANLQCSAARAACGY
jgi:hypothetical protein